MIRLKDYIYEAVKSNPVEVPRDAVRNLDAYVKSNKSVYVCSGYWPGSEVQGWNYTFDDLCDGQYMSNIGSIRLIDNYLEVTPANGKTAKDLVKVWLLKPELAQWLDFKGAGEDVSFTATNQSAYSKKRGTMVYSIRDLEPFASAPAEFKKIFGLPHMKFERAIGAKKNTLSHDELKNILGL